jgi:hypothetical protein
LSALLPAGRTLAVAARFVALAAGTARGVDSSSIVECLLAATDDLSPRVRAND